MCGKAIQTDSAGLQVRSLPHTDNLRYKLQSIAQSSCRIFDGAFVKLDDFQQVIKTRDSLQVRLFLAHRRERAGNPVEIFVDVVECFNLGISIFSEVRVSAEAKFVNILLS